MAGHWIIWDLIENLAAFFWFRQWTGFWFLPCYEWIHLKYFVYQKVWKSNVLLWYLVCCVVYYIICRVYTNCGKTIPKLNKKEARPIYMLVLTNIEVLFWFRQNPIYFIVTLLDMWQEFIVLILVLIPADLGHNLISSWTWRPRNFLLLSKGNFITSSMHFL